MKYDNMSIDGKVGFTDKNHKYHLIGSNRFVFNSVTTLLKDYKEEFDSASVAAKVVKMKSSKYFGRDPQQLSAEWRALGKKAAEEGTLLHSYGEALLNHEEMEAPDLPKAAWVPGIVKILHDEGYEVAKTELLLYSKDLKLAGQSDIILKKEIFGETSYMIYDWKFTKKPLEKRSRFIPKIRRYVNMKAPFHHLMDCNWIHYSIQLAMYQTLSGQPERITEKVMIVVNDGGYEMVPAYPMRIFWDKNLKLQLVHETWNGKFYDSRRSKLLTKWPKDIKGR